MQRNRTNYIVVHSSATRSGANIGVQEIDKWHKARGWSGVGYHFVITRDAALQHGRDVNDVGAHAKGKNSESIGICLVGGVADDGKTSEFNFTISQLSMLQDLLVDLTAVFFEAAVVGHRDVMPPGYTECPSFDVAKWWDNGE